jgi:hypothetical protein
MESELPKCTKSRILKLDPRWFIPYTESDDPSRANPRRDNAEPIDTKSSTERLLPNLAMPYKDIELPIRLKLLQLRELPKDA